MPKHSSRRSIFMLFLGLGFTIEATCFALWSAANVVWVDFLHTNPNRTHANALTMLALSPVYGAFGAISMNALALIIGAIGAKLASLRSGRVPFWFLVLLVPLCGLASSIQTRWFFASFEDGPQPPLWNMATRTCVLQVPSLLICWLWTCRSHHRASLPSLSKAAKGTDLHSIEPY